MLIITTSKILILDNSYVINGRIITSRGFLKV